MSSFRLAAAVLALALPVSTARAQSIPDGPVSTFDGRLVLGGEVVATVGGADDTAFFNYTDYEHNALRMFRLGLSAAWRPVARIALVGEVRSEDFEHARPFAAYARIRPWADRAFDLQVGRIPPTFGAFGRRAYGTDNPLIGYPLAYQYLTSIRADSVPATPDDLLRMRARGWRSNFPIGSLVATPGVPLMSAFRWDTGIQARWNSAWIEMTGAVTSGTLSDPRVADNNDGSQLSGRIALRPTTGLVVGASAARGAWLSRDVARLIAQPDTDYPQTAWGVDVEYSRDHWVVRSELVHSRWRVPFALAKPTGEDLDALGTWVEGRYRITPRLFAAARIDHLGFSKITGTLNAAQPQAWDAPVTRFEIAAGLYLQRNLIARAALQHDARDAGRVHKRAYLAGQLSYWF